MVNATAQLPDPAARFFRFPPEIDQGRQLGKTRANKTLP